MQFFGIEPQPGWKARHGVVRAVAFNGGSFVLLISGHDDGLFQIDTADAIIRVRGGL